MAGLNSSLKFVRPYRRRRDSQPCADAEWVRKLPKRHHAGSDEQWLAALDIAAQKVCDDPAICFVIRDATSIAFPPTREAGAGTNSN